MLGSSLKVTVVYLKTGQMGNPGLQSWKGGLDMKVRRALVAALIFMGISGNAIGEQVSSFFLPNLRVNQVSATEFEVLEGPNKGARTYWCRAAFHAQFLLGRKSGRLYISRPFGPAQTASGKRGVSFSLTETSTVSNSVSPSIRQEGTTLLINHALQFCRDSASKSDR